MPGLEISRIADSGLGFGEGTISFLDRSEEVGIDVLSHAEGIIQSPDILTPVSADDNGNVIDDDGCGDGRYVNKVFEGNVERSKSLNRPKVFGGGLTMAVSTKIGLDLASGNDVKTLFAQTISDLEGNNLNFGAHTDNHAEGENSGCGAIDKAPNIIANAVKYEDSIKSAIEGLGIDTAGLDDVLSSYAAYSDEIHGKTHSGKEVIKKIKAKNKIVKELGGPHIEMYILLNNCRDYTVDQSVVRNETQGKVDVFAVDVWRLKDIASGLYNDENEQREAFLSELVYTLATAATLTKGDLPVYLVNEERQTVTV